MFCSVLFLLQINAWAVVFSHDYFENKWFNSYKFSSKARKNKYGTYISNKLLEKINQYVMFEWYW